MITMYKLVSQEGTTLGGMKWEIGKTNRAIFAGTEMCTNQVLHCYSDPRLAVIFNPIHANISNPRLYEIECSAIVNTDGLKYACKEQTPQKRLNIPQISLTQKIAFAIKCALLLYKEVSFITWANSWLDGTDRTKAAAAWAARAARTAEAAEAALWAAEAALWAARAAEAAEAATFGKQTIEIIQWIMENIE